MMMIQAPLLPRHLCEAALSAERRLRGPWELRLEEVDQGGDPAVFDSGWRAAWLMVQVGEKKTREQAKMAAGESGDRHGGEQAVGSQGGNGDGSLGLRKDSGR